MKNRLISSINSFIFTFTVCLSHAEADEKTIYHSQDDKSNEQAGGCVR